jgi:hypothetical protein
MCVRIVCSPYLVSFLLALSIYFWWCYIVEKRRRVLEEAKLIDVSCMCERMRVSYGSVEKGCDAILAKVDLINAELSRRAKEKLRE